MRHARDRVRAAFDQRAPSLRRPFQ